MLILLHLHSCLTQQIFVHYRTYEQTLSSLFRLFQLHVDVFLLRRHLSSRHEYLIVSCSALTCRSRRLQYSSQGCNGSRRNIYQLIHHSLILIVQVLHRSK